MTRQSSNLSAETSEKFNEQTYAKFISFNKLLNWELVEASRSEMRLNAEVGTVLPGMSATTGLKRKLAVFLGKVVLRFAQIFLRGQRAFNLSTLCLVDEMSQSLRKQGSIIADQERRIFELEAQVHRMSGDLHGARSRFARFQRELAQEFCRLEQDLLANRTSVQ